MGWAYQAADFDGDAGAGVDESVDLADAVVLVVGGLDLEGEAVLPRVAQLVRREASARRDLQLGRLEADARLHRRVGVGGFGLRHLHLVAHVCLVACLSLLAGRRC